MTGKVLLFDLDGTLYPSSLGTERSIIPSVQLEVSNSLNISADEAKSLINQMSRKYGYSIRGLAEERLIADPAELVERIYSRISRARIEVQPLLKLAFASLNPIYHVAVVTNSSRGHAAEVLSRLELTDYIGDVFGIQDLGYDLKPSRSVYLLVARALGVDPVNFIYFDDSIRNLHTAWKMGSRCVLVGNGMAEPPYFWENHLRVHHLAPDHIESTYDLPAFLKANFADGNI